MYYALIMLSVAMLGGCFALNDAYRKIRTSNLLSSMESSCIGAAAGLVILFIINGVKLEFTPFTLIMSFLVAINGIAFTYLSFKALETTNLSLYSLFLLMQETQKKKLNKKKMPQEIVSPRASGDQRYARWIGGRFLEKATE